MHVMAETFLLHFDEMFDLACKKFEKERQRALAETAVVK